MDDRNGAIFALTRNGASLGARLAGELSGATLQLPYRLKDENLSLRENLSPKSEVTYFKEWRETVEKLFNHNSFLVFIGATGIAVRSITPYLRSKATDPAVVVVDEGGRYAISLLSGHQGGANRLAEEIAEILGAEAIITTATDFQGISYPPDLLGAELKAVVEPASLVKEFNRRLAEGETLNLYSPFPLLKKISQEYRWQGWPHTYGKTVLRGPAVVVSPYRLESTTREILAIKPPCLLVGVGCRQGVALEKVEEAIEEVFSRYLLEKRCIKALATVDLKAQEKALRAFCDQRGIPLVECSRDAIDKLKGSYRESPRVIKELGVGGVCEPAAMLASEGGPVLVEKQKHGPVTVSVAQERSWWWDWDQEIESY